jgi:periplasmic copper chaperone A
VSVVRARLLETIGAVALVATMAVATAATADLRVLAAHAPATPAAATSAAAYLTVHNVGATGDQLLRVSTPLAAQVQMHRSQLEGGVMRMRPVASLEVPIGGSIEMSTGATHLMLIGLKRPLQAGEQFPLRLEFARAGVLEAIVKVLPAGGAARGATRP